MQLRAALIVAVALAVPLAATTVRAQEKLEIFSWWAGDEGPALQALIDRYAAQNPGIQVVNSTVTGGSGVNARAVLKTRMLGGDPPDSGPPSISFSRWIPPSPARARAGGSCDPRC